jgi:hypothetical protein
MRSAILPPHIIAGTLGLLSGFVAVFLREGSRKDALAGKVFVIPTLVTALRYALSSQASGRKER